MNGLTTEELDRMEELEKAATPGPWTAYPTELDNGATRIDGPEPVSASWCFQVASVGSRIAPRRDANAAFIPALRNAAPALIAAARENAKLRAVVGAASHEIQVWRDGHNADNEDHGPFLVYAEDVAPCEEEMCDYMKRLDAARSAYDAACAGTPTPDPRDAVVEAARAYHAIASAPYDENRVEEFLELQANMGAALSALDAKENA